jgi:transcriptional antiterminator RfaH
MRSKPRKEVVLWRQLLERDIEVFFPRVRVNPVNPRSRKIRPYFPGYLFVRTDIEEVGLSTFQWMPHAIGLILFGGEPAYVPDALINAIRKRVDEINEAGGELFDGLKRGEPVRVHEGPFAGYEAIFDERVSGKERVRVLLKLIDDREMLVELDAGMIERKKKRS